MPSMMKAPHSKGMKCPMCDGGTCKYAEGGKVKSGAKHQAEGDKRQAAIARREIEMGNPPKPPGAMMTPKKHPKKMADGGAVKDLFDPAKVDSNKAEKGVHHSHDRFDKRDKGQSRAGSFTQHGLDSDAKGVHRAKLSELKDMKGRDRKYLAEGGEVGEPDGDEMDPDMELSHGLGKELMGALDSKDHKAVMSALEACVLHCMNKDEPEDDDV